jgi:hypothetical protein
MPVAEGPKPNLLPQRTPGENPTPVEETRSAPVVVPDLAATRKFPRRNQMFA